MNNGALYQSLDSPLHGLDPRVKIVAVIVLSIVLLRVEEVGLGIVTVILAALVWLSRIPLSRVLKTLQPFLLFFAVLFLLYALFTPGTVWVDLGPLPLRVTAEGLDLAISQVGKFLLLVVVASLLTMTTRPEHLTAGLERLLRPLTTIGIPSHDLALMVSLSFRFIPEVASEFHAIRQAQLARGFDGENRRPANLIRSIVHLSSPLVVNVFRRCDQLVDAMEARGYGPGQRTYLYELQLQTADWACLAALVPLAAIILASG